MIAPPFPMTRDEHPLVYLGRLTGHHLANPVEYPAEVLADHAERLERMAANQAGNRHQPRMRPNTKVQRSYQIKPSTIDKIDALSRRLGISRNMVIDTIVEAYVSSIDTLATPQVSDPLT